MGQKPLFLYIGQRKNQDKMVIASYSTYTSTLEEKRIMSQIDFVLEMINEGIVDTAKEKVKKIIRDIIQFFSTAKKLTSKFLNKVAKFFSVVLDKMKPEKKEKVNKELGMLIDHVGRTISGNVDKQTAKSAVEKALDSALQQGILDKDNMTASFKNHKDEIIKIIREKMSEELEKAKEEVLRNLEEVDEKVNKKMGIGKKASIFAIGSVTMMVFGMIDNLGLFLGMSGIEDWITKMGFDAQVSAGLGNTFSDVLGAVLGGAVMYLVTKITKRKGEGTAAQQVVGVTVGCLLPVIGKVIFSVI